MREILFRGKRVDNGEWVYGDYFSLFERPCIKFGESDKEIVGVKAETVGQYTGLTDIKGVKIYEGDIVCTRFTIGNICSVGDVQFDCGTFGVEWTVNKEHRTMVGIQGNRHNLRTFEDDIVDYIEVIGNIHDNPELLEQKEPIEVAWVGSKKEFHKKFSKPYEYYNRDTNEIYYCIYEDEKAIGKRFNRVELGLFEQEKHNYYQRLYEEVAQTRIRRNL